MRPDKLPPLSRRLALAGRVGSARASSLFLPPAYILVRCDCEFIYSRPWQILCRRRLHIVLFSDPRTVANMPRKMKNKAVVPSEEPPTKRTKLFDEDAASDDDAVNLTINEEFAKRFEHNKKREEKQRRMFVTASHVLFNFLIHHSRGKVCKRRLGRRIIHRRGRR